ncbi:MAG TPA: endonuclease III [bacterium]|nr:endonuclease III [bacterium]HQL64006.1 endonuclease III [bacterium]
MKNARAIEICRRLKKEYPDIRCPLNYSTPLELLIASILSAQCTDERVNKVTPAIFKKYRTAKDWANADPAVLEEEIKSTGFYRNKAKAIRNCCAEIAERFGGELPQSMEDLTSLPGVGRKTANLLRGYIFGQPSIVVDTHCIRVSGRLGLTTHKDPEKIEQDLISLIPSKERTGFSHRLIHHGRVVCQARKPRCTGCCLFDLCPFPEK